MEISDIIIFISVQMVLFLQKKELFRDEQEGIMKNMGLGERDAS